MALLTSLANAAEQLLGLLHSLAEGLGNLSGFALRAIARRGQLFRDWTRRLNAEREPQLALPQPVFYQTGFQLAARAQRRARQRLEAGN